MTEAYEVDTCPWFETTGYQDTQRYAALDRKQQRLVDEFRENGYVVLEDSGLDTTTIDAAVRSLESTETRSEYHVDGRLQDAWRDIKPVARIAESSLILDTLQLLYQRDPIPFQTLNFRVATQQRAHSDTIHFNTLPHGFMCGVWVALEDVDVNNGPLFYYPGSHRLPVFHLHDLGLESTRIGPSGVREYTPDIYREYEDKIEQVLAKSPYERSQALLKKGQALIWSANIFHGGSLLLDPTRTRMSQVTHYYFPGCIYYTPLLSDPLQQRWTLRQVMDIRNGRIVPEFVNSGGKRSMVSLLRGALRHWRRR
jgi:hypothetical protein